MSKLEGIPQIHYISIEESKERRDNLHKQFNEFGISNFIPHIFSRYVHGDYHIEGDNLESIDKRGYGPTTSHLITLKEWYENSTDDEVLIVEDDLSFETVQYWGFSWKDFRNKLPSDWNCIQLICLREYSYNNYQFEKRKLRDYCAAAYLIKREYVKLLLDNYYDGNKFTFYNIKEIPILEHIIFSFKKGVYNFPLFVEEVEKTDSTFLGPTTQGAFHHSSYNDVINWWKDTGQYLSIDNIMKPHCDILHLVRGPSKSWLYQYDKSNFLDSNINTTFSYKIPEWCENICDILIIPEEDYSPEVIDLIVKKTNPKLIFITSKRSPPNFNFDYIFIPDTSDCNQKRQIIIDTVMNTPNSLLEKFALDTENPELNIKMASSYEDLNQWAAAYTYYFRAAERTDDDHVGYKCLIRAAICVKAQSTREVTEKSLLQHAVTLCPDRPEAYYFLSLLYEKSEDFQNSYLNADQGLRCSDCEGLPDIPEYKGKWQFIYQKAVVGWWWGKGNESRKNFWELVDNYWEQISEEGQKIIEDNISKMGLSSNSQNAIFYNKENCEKLRLSFNGIDKIDRSYAQIMQDIFVLCALDGKENGTFLEIGTADPIDRNNTYLLETKFGWSGAGIELNKKFFERYKKERPNVKIYNEDATESDYSVILSEIAVEGIVDYLQLDIEPARNTYKCLERIPFDNYKFRVITFEHDHYVDITREVREKSRNFLQSKGYVMVANDLSSDGESSFEDWWVHPELVDSDVIDAMTDIGEGVKKVSDYLLAGRQIKKKKESFEVVFAEAQNTLWIVDNFYQNPHEVREFALAQDYHIGGIGRGYIGNRTHEQFLFPGLKLRFEQIMGRKITKWEEWGMNGRFQYCWSGQPQVWHTDCQMWGGMIYLTPNAPYDHGTAMYANKKNGARNYTMEGWDESWKDVPGDCHLDGAPFEPVDVAGNVFNRLVIFDAKNIHSSAGYFGTVKENCRLWQMFFFDTEW